MLIYHTALPFTAMQRRCTLPYPAAQVRELVKVGQAAFLTQLLEVGFMHGDPHPGNLLKVRSCQETVW